VGRLQRIELPNNCATAWAHPGTTDRPDGSVIVAATSGTAIHHIVDCRVVGTTDIPTTECHDLAAHADGSTWIADPGNKAHVDDGAVFGVTREGQVIRVGSSGERLAVLAPPTKEWMPTGVALDDFGRGSEGRLFVADGYGAGLVHAFDAAGSHLWTCDAASTGMPFSTPHGVVIDNRSSTPRLLVADRGNRRIVALTLEGAVIGTFGETFLTSPSAFALVGDLLWVAELHGALVAIAEDGRIVAREGATGAEGDVGWPNRVVDGRTTQPEDDGQLRSPHGIAAHTSGSLIVAEWVIGGRVSSLLIS
jgi:DNA-binding beta-propeller fold protein YncE